MVAAPQIQLSAILILLASESNDVLKNEQCGRPPLAMRRSLRIVGGSTTMSGAWPWQVVVFSGNRMICGGTLIDREFVLTAAHCLRQEPMHIVAGEYNLSERDGFEQERRVLRTFRHPDYNKEDADNDIALLKLSSPLELSREVWPACLPRQDEDVQPDTTATIVGWGATSYKRTEDGNVKFGRHNMLQQANVPIVDFAQCRLSYGAGLNEEHVICAGYRDGKIDSCQGDSGGGLLITRDNKWHVYGVTSFGDECAKENAYGIYTRTAFYVSWIRRIVRKHASSNLFA